MRDLTSLARKASISKLKEDALVKKARNQKLKIGSHLPELKLIGTSDDPQWSYILNTVQDKHHFYESAFKKV